MEKEKKRKELERRLMTMLYVQTDFYDSLMRDKDSKSEYWIEFREGCLMDAVRETVKAYKELKGLS